MLDRDVFQPAVRRLLVGVGVGDRTAEIPRWPLVLEAAHRWGALGLYAATVSLCGWLLLRTLSG